MSPLSHSNAAASSRSSLDERSSMTNETTENKNNARSPLITAQERKRMIRERRRRKRPFQRSNSMVMGGAQSSASPASSKKRSLLLRRANSMPRIDSSINSTSSQVASSCFSPPLGKKKQLRPIPQLGSPLSMTSASNSLFARVGGERRTKAGLTRRSSLSSSSRSLVFTEETTQPPTNLCSSNSSQSQCLTPKPSAASLFGAVMQRTTTTPKPGDDIVDEAAEDEKSEQLQEHALSNMTATPVKTSMTPQRHVMWNLVSTPCQDKKPHAAFQKNRVAASPGGFGLLQVLDSVTSPFRKADSPDSKASPSSPQRDRFDEWHDASLNDSGLDTRDWSLKRRLRIECHPGSCSPALLTGSSSNYAIETRAMQHFLGAQPFTIPKTMEDCLVQWGAGLMYWQHPAIYPLPQADVKDTNVENVPPSKQIVASKQKVESKADTKEAATKSKLSKTKALADAVRGRSASLHQLVRMANPLDREASHNEDLARKHREREWQQAFRSLYFTWNQRVDSLRDDLDADDPLDRTRIGQTCFYSVASEHVVLFRASVCASSEEDTSTTTDSLTIVPMIVLSGATIQLRDKLEFMSISFTLLSQDNAGTLPKEYSENEGHKNEEEEATLVRAELEALRRAQADGVTAGADVSVSMKQTKGGRADTQHNIVPICITGGDDCATFFELYLNTCGRLSVNSAMADGVPQDVPLLLARRLGPFIHSSLKSLSVTGRREDNFSKKVDIENNNKRLAEQNQSTVELRGPILPCALDELLRSAASRMLIHKQQYDEQKPSKRGKYGFRSGAGNEQAGRSPQENIDVGSHYFVLHLQPLEEPQESVHGGFALLNGAETLWNQQQDACDSSEQENGFQECHHGEVMSMAVWDISRPNAIAYKVERAASSLSHSASARRSM